MAQLLKARHEVLRASHSRSAAKVDLADPDSIRRLCASVGPLDAPGWVQETLLAMRMDRSPGVPAAKVAQVYAKAVEGSMTGQILDAV